MTAGSTRAGRNGKWFSYSCSARSDVAISARWLDEFVTSQVLGAVAVAPSPGDEGEPMRSATAVHEAAHSVAAHALGVPLSYITIRKTEDSIGRCKLDSNIEIRPGHELDPVVILVAGGMGERFALGRDPWHSVNWFIDDPDSDEDRAREWIAAECARDEKLDELGVRHWAQLRARGLLFSRWKTVEAVAEELERKTTLLGSQVMDIIARTKREEEQDRDRLLGFRPVTQEVALAKISTRGRTAVVGQATRTFEGLKAQALRSVRSAHATEGFTVRGYASVYNQLSHDLGGFRERISPGAFDAVLATDPDVHFVWDHDTRYVLSRTRSGTLRLNSDAVGLHVDADVGPYSYAKDLRVALERGDIDQASFSFNVADGGDEWSVDGNDNVRRTIRTVSGLYDVTVTAQGAYPQTSMGVV